MTNIRQYRKACASVNDTTTLADRVVLSLQACSFYPLIRQLIVRQGAVVLFLVFLHIRREFPSASTLESRGIFFKSPEGGSVFNTKARVTVLGLAGMLAACGGGGGGGGSGASGGTGGGPAPLVYTGNSNPAVITTSNAAILTANIFGGADSSVALGSAVASSGSSARDLTRGLSRAARATPMPAGWKEPRVTADPVDFGTQPCAAGGTVRSFGNLNVSGTGTLTFIW